MKHVLVIHSYHEGLPWTDGQNAGICETLANDGGFELAIEYMDTKRIPYEKAAPVFADYLERKWENHPFDALIVTDNSALDFVSARYARLFSGVPVFFSGINNFTPPMIEPFNGNASGVIQALNPEKNIELIQALQPDLRKLVIVAGTTPTAKAIVNEVKSILDKKSFPFESVWLCEMDTVSLQSELAEYGPQDAVLLCNFNRDANGVYYSHEEGARMIAQCAGAPVYAMADNYLGTGVAGGFVVASHDQGRVAAELCIEALETGRIPDVVLSSPNVYMFDYEALTCFNLLGSALPASAIILNEPVSFYHQYKRLIWNATIVFVLLLCAFVGVSYGLLRSRRAEVKMRESEENLRVTLKSIGDGVISTDVECRIVGMNRVAEILTGWSHAEAVGRKLAEVFNIINEKTREPQRSPAEEALEKGEIVGMSNHTILVSKGGEEYQVADSCAPIRDDEHCICGVVMVFRDVTEEYALQEQLRQSQKMDAIGQLAGGVAHDLNNMLGGIMGGAELLRESLPQEGDEAEFLEIIQDSARRAAGLTGRLLAFARRQPAASTPVDVHHILEETVALLKQTIDRRIRLEHRLEAESARVVGDDAQLQSVFMNLGINAAHAMPEGGSLFISTRIVDVSETYRQASGFSLEVGSYLQIEVRDTGCGIVPENLRRVFEPFFTTKESGKGTGLGLAAAHGTVTQHGGAISVYSEVGRGTVFHILLPLTEEAATALPACSGPVYGEGIILLVDDEPVMRATGAAFLKEYGYDVLLAENGRQAVDIVAEKGAEIDLVVLDMIMPEMNGHDCFFCLQKTNPDLPVILSSGFSQAEDLENMKKSGLAGFIRKPFRGADFSRVVATALKRTNQPS